MIRFALSNPQAEPVTLKSVWDLIVQTVSNWATINPPHLAAALAFYTMLSLAPLLVISVAIAGFVLGRQAALSQIVLHIQHLAGPAAAKGVQAIIEQIKSGHSRQIATITGAFVLLFGASGVFSELRDSLNRVWRTTTPEHGWKDIIRNHLFAFLLVLAAGLLLLVSLLTSAFLAIAGKHFAGMLPLPSPFLQFANFIATAAMATLLFALLYRYLPDVRIKWFDVWIGAAITALLFTVGKLLIGFYLGRVTVGSPYGAAGSLVVFLVWIYYSAQVFFLGAEFTRIFSERHGSRAPLRPEQKPPKKNPRTNRSQPKAA
ncbi:MAG TPA: YihY/virulence factor BrkB family protein [Bryobacteraceae bacterium]